MFSDGTLLKEKYGSGFLIVLKHWGGHADCDGFPLGIFLCCATGAFETWQFSGVRIVPCYDFYIERNYDVLIG